MSIYSLVVEHTKIYVTYPYDSKDKALSIMEGVRAKYTEHKLKCPVLRIEENSNPSTIALLMRNIDDKRYTIDFIFDKTKNTE